MSEERQTGRTTALMLAAIAEAVGHPGKVAIFQDHALSKTFRGTHLCKHTVEGMCKLLQLTAMTIEEVSIPRENALASDQRLTYQVHITSTLGKRRSTDE